MCISYANPCLGNVTSDRMILGRGGNVCALPHPNYLGCAKQGDRRTVGKRIRGPVNRLAGTGGSGQILRQRAFNSVGIRACPDAVRHTLAWRELPIDRVDGLAGRGELRLQRLADGEGIAHVVPRAHEHHRAVVVEHE